MTQGTFAKRPSENSSLNGKNVPPTLGTRLKRLVRDVSGGARRFFPQIADGATAGSAVLPAQEPSVSRQSLVSPGWPTPAETLQPVPPQQASVQQQQSAESSHHAFGPPPTDSEKLNSWADVCFLHALPGGNEDQEAIAVLRDGSLRRFISCKGINALLSDHHDQEFLARQFANLANIADCDMQIIVTSRNLPVEEYLSKYQQLIKTDDTYLKWYSSYTDTWFRLMQEVSFVPQREFYVIVSYTPPDALAGSQWKKRSKAQHDEFVARLDRITKTVGEQLRQSGLRPAVMSIRAVRQLIYHHLNPNLSKREPVPPPRSAHNSEASSLARSALSINWNHVKLDNSYIGSLYMAEPPHETWFGWMSDLLTLGVEYTLSIFIHKCDQEQVRKQLAHKHRVSYACNAGLFVPDVEGLEATHTAATAIQEFLRSSNKAFDVSMYIRTHASSLQQLRSNADEIRRVFNNRGARMEIADGMQFATWQATLPVGVDTIAITHRLMSPIVGTMWPFFTASCGTPDGVPFGFALASREPVLLNPFFRGAGKDANNMFVVGTTGAGKSFAISMLMLRLLPMGMKFVLIDKTIDKNGSYRFITDLLGPEMCAYIDLGPSCGQVINPFDLGPDDKIGAPSASKLEFLLMLLDIMLAPQDQEEMNVEDKALLDELLREAYREAGTRDTIPTMTDLMRVTEAAAKADSEPAQRDRYLCLSRALKLFTNGSSYGGFIDGTTNVDTDKMFIVFDTREVNDPRLERMAAFLLAEFVRRKAQENKARKIKFAAIIDEAATLMRFKAGARLLDDLSRRGRQYGMMLVTITQQLKDFFRQAEIADSVVKNAHMKILLRQDASDLQLLRDVLRLNDPEIAAIANFSRDEEKRKDSQCLLIVGGVRGTLRLIPSPMDYWVCTSEPINDIPKRKEIIVELREQFPEMDELSLVRRAVYELGMRTANQ
ncbi:MAG: ATP-binding protein [Candidatus Obscuribacterales bacterium]